MRQLNKLLCSFIFISTVTNVSFAQNEFSLGLQNHLWESHFMNPAYIDKDKVTIAIPTVAASAYSDGFQLKDMVNIENDTAFVNFNSDFEEMNTVRANASVVPIGIGYRVNDHLAIGIDFKMVSDNYVSFSKDLTDLARYGNSRYLDETKNVRLVLSTNAYSALGFRFAYKRDKLTLGAKVKYLMGGSQVDIKNGNIALTTSSDAYQTTVQSNILITSTEPIFINNDSAGVIDDYDYDPFVNTGIAMDLGASYELSEKLTLGFSILDLGSITYNNRTSETVSQGSFTYDGEDLDNIIDNSNFSIEDQLDSLAEILEFGDSRKTSFTYILPSRMFLSGRYKMNEKLQLGGGIITEFYKKDVNLSVGVTANYDLIPKFLNVGLSYAYMNETATNLGVNAVLTLFPIQVFVMTDNVLAMSSMNSLTGRAGLNIRF